MGEAVIFITCVLIYLIIGSFIATRAVGEETVATGNEIGRWLFIILVWPLFLCFIGAGIIVAILIFSIMGCLTLALDTLDEHRAKKAKPESHTPHCT